MRNLHDHNGTRADEPRIPIATGVKSLSTQVSGELLTALAGEAKHRSQTTVPRVISELMLKQIRGLDDRRTPLWVSQGRPVVDTHRQVRTRSGAAASLVNEAIEPDGLDVECVNPELVVGDFGRHPVKLRVDDRHPLCHHSINQVSR